MQDRRLGSFRKVCRCKKLGMQGCCADPRAKADAMQAKVTKGICVSICQGFRPNQLGQKFATSLSVLFETTMLGMHVLLGSPVLRVFENSCSVWKAQIAVLLFLPGWFVFVPALPSSLVCDILFGHGPGKGFDFL